MYPRKLTWLASLTLILMVGSPGSTGAFSRGPDPLTPADAARATNDFAWDLYAQLHGGSGNLFFSPASIELALAMTWTGARGETAAEMGRTLRLPRGQYEEFATVAEAFGQLQHDLIPDEPTATLRIANRLWGQQGFGFRPSFLDPLATHFEAGLQEVDFRNDTEAARQTINSWVEEKTEDKIQDLLPSGSLQRDIRLVLTNAIYFLGKWQRPFQGSDTADRPFHLGDGSSVQVPTMKQKGHFQYTDDDQTQVLSLPYRGGEIEMLVVLPREKDGLAGLEARLDQDLLDSWSSGLAEASVDILLPKFTLTGEFSLAKVLGAMGMQRAFTNAADFSGMTDGQGLAISDVIHKSFVDVYEKGTEAAAATAVTMRLTSIQAPDQDTIAFIADHPFLFLIRDVETGTVLFLGRLTDPR